MKRVLAFAPVPALFFAGAIIARAALRYAPARIAPDRAQPLLVVTAWGAYGSLAFAILATTIVLASIALFVALARAGTPDARTIAIVCAASLAACLAWPYVFSSDVYAYAAYGDLAARGITPYALAPAALHDTLLDAARWQWGGVRFPPCVYGPAFVLFAGAIVRTATALGFAAPATLASFRIAAMFALLATVAFAGVALRSLEPSHRGRLLALGALNPVVLWSVAEGHNDVYALALVAFFFASAGAGTMLRPKTFAFLPLAMLVKASVGLLAFACVLDALLVQRRRVLPVVAAAASGLAVTLALGVPPLLPALHALAATGRYAPTVSLAGLVGPVGALAIGAGLTIVAIAVLDRGRRAGYGWFGLAAVTVLPNPYPWYAIVFVVLAVIAERARASRALYAVTICGAVRYLPDAFGNMSASAAAIASAVQVVPIAFALSGLRADLAPRDDGAPGPPFCS